MSEKSQALSRILDLMHQHDISLADIRQIEKSSHPAARSIPKLFYYIGGILIFAGLGVFISSFWTEIGFGGQVIVTLGIGFFCYLMGIAAAKDSRFDKAATPLFLISALLQPTGILLVLEHFSTTPDPSKGLFFMALLMLVQQVPTLIALKRPVLAFTSLAFYGIVFTAGFDILAILSGNMEWVGVVLGGSYLMIASALARGEYYSITPFWFFIGALIFLSSLFDIVDGSYAELLYLGASAAMVYMGTIVTSRMLVFMGTAAMLCYIGYFSFEHFENSLGWPLVLIIIGVSFIGLGSLALKLSARIKRGA